MKCGDNVPDDGFGGEIALVTQCQSVVMYNHKECAYRQLKEGKERRENQFRYNSLFFLFTN